jgi:hypothetical protein
VGTLVSVVGGSHQVFNPDKMAQNLRKMPSAGQA